jgi:hypothetical protein
MRCPRCHIQLPDNADRCPDCKLPKPKGLSPQRDLKAENKRSKGRKPKAASSRPKWVNALLAVTALIMVSFVGLYLFSFLSSQPQELDPNLAQPALAKLRQEPSVVSGLSVDEYMTQQLEKSRRIGNLLKYQGWTVSPLKGSKTKLVIAFTYEERDNTQYRAEWVADVANNTFTPRTELAVAAYKR